MIVNFFSLCFVYSRVEEIMEEERKKGNNHRIRNRMSGLNERVVCSRETPYKKESKKSYEEHE